MRQNFHSELITVLEILFGFLPHAYSRGRTGDDNCARRQRRTLGQEADQLGNAEDEVTVSSQQRVQ